MICLLLTSKILSGHFSFPQEANPSLRCRFKSSWPSSSSTTQRQRQLSCRPAAVDSEIRKLFTATTTLPPPPLLFFPRTVPTRSLCVEFAVGGEDKPRHLLCSEGKPYRANQRCMEPCLWSFIVFISKSTAPRGTFARD